jgi:hypothetical protein
VTKAKKWPTHSSPPKKYRKYIFILSFTMDAYFLHKGMTDRDILRDFGELQKKVKHVYFVTYHLQVGVLLVGHSLLLRCNPSNKYFNQ